MPSCPGHLVALVTCSKCLFEYVCSVSVCSVAKKLPACGVRVCVNVDCISFSCRTAGVLHSANDGPCLHIGSCVEVKFSTCSDEGIASAYDSGDTCPISEAGAST